MKRKDYDKKANTIVEAALGLFLEKGYRQTSINDILKKVKVAKGTFYHYFASKEDLLDSIVKQFAEKMMISTREIFDRDDLNALEKFNMAIDAGQSKKAEEKDLMILLTQYISKEENLIFKHKITNRILESSKPLMVALINQGNDEGIFSVPFPEAAADLIFLLGEGVKDKFTAIIKELSSGGDPKILLGKVNQLFRTYEDTVEKMLGVPSGSLYKFEMGPFKLEDFA